MTLTKRILGTLRKARNGLNGLQVDELINENPDDFYADTHVVLTTLVRCVKRGFVLNEGKTKCNHCLAVLNNYRITEEGIIFHEKGCSVRKEVQRESKEDQTL